MSFNHTCAFLLIRTTCLFYSLERSEARRAESPELLRVNRDEAAEVEAQVVKSVQNQQNRNQGRPLQQVQCGILIFWIHLQCTIFIISPMDRKTP